MIAPILSVEPGMGDTILILAFVVIVIGGIGSMRGAFVAALLIGLVDTLGRSFCHRYPAPGDGALPGPYCWSSHRVNADLRADGAGAVFAACWPVSGAGTLMAQTLAAPVTLPVRRTNRLGVLPAMIFLASHWFRLAPRSRRKATCSGSLPV